MKSNALPSSKAASKSSRGGSLYCAPVLVGIAIMFVKFEAGIIVGIGHVYRCSDSQQSQEEEDEVVIRGGSWNSTDFLRESWKLTDFLQLFCQIHYQQGKPGARPSVLVYSRGPFSLYHQPVLPP